MRTKIVQGLLGCAMMLAIPAGAQIPAGMDPGSLGRNDPMPIRPDYMRTRAVISPVIHPDRRVTFKLNAPEASQRPLPRPAPAPSTPSQHTANQRINHSKRERPPTCSYKSSSFARGSLSDATCGSTASHRPLLMSDTKLSMESTVFSDTWHSFCENEEQGGGRERGVRCGGGSRGTRRGGGGGGGGGGELRRSLRSPGWR